MDFDFVSTRVATGAAIQSADDVQMLAAKGVTHIVDCRGDFDDTPLLAVHPGVTYLWNGTDDDGQHKPFTWFAKTLDFALPALALPQTRLYLHCAAGVNRGPSAAYAILRASIGLPAAVVLDMIHQARPVTLHGIRYALDADAALVQLGYIDKDL